MDKDAWAPSDSDGTNVYFEISTSQSFEVLVGTEVDFDDYFVVQAVDTGDGIFTARCTGIARETLSIAILVETKTSSGESNIGTNSLVSIYSIFLRTEIWLPEISTLWTFSSGLDND